jgi:flagellar biosynthesis anti-sigma factor FlgM
MNINPESLYRMAQSSSAPTPSGPGRRQGTPTPGSPGLRDDAFSLSTRAETFLSARTRLEGATSTSRSERIAQLAGLIARGEYKVDASAIADAMLADDATSQALGLGPAR